MCAWTPLPYHAYRLGLLAKERRVSCLYSPRSPVAHKAASRAHAGSFILSFLNGVFSTHHLHTVGFFRMAPGLVIGLTVRCLECTERGAGQPLTYPGGPSLGEGGA